MKVNFLIIIFVSCLQSSHQQSDRINDGASTSRDNPRDLNEDLEECELIGIAESLIFKLIARDANEADLREMVKNEEHFKELEAFDKAVRSDFIDAKYSSRRTTDMVRQRSRLTIFIIKVRELIIQKLRDVCTGHFRSQLICKYDAQKDIIMVQENYLLSQNQPCLCENDQELLRERFILNSTVSTSNYFSQQFDFVFQLSFHRNQMQVTELRVYHIIPIKLLSEFFQTWLSDESTVVTSRNLNDCVVTLFGRLKRSMQKLFLVNIVKLYGNSRRIPIDIHSRAFFSEAVELTHGMLAGNIVLGPVDTGPFHRSGDELMEAVEFIIGSLHHRDSLRLSRRLRYFINHASEWNLATRFINGVTAFLIMYATLYQYDITPFNPTQWVQRRPTDEDLMNIPGMTEELKQELKQQSFWDIKKPDDNRNKRSVFQTSVSNLKQYFTRFISDAMTIFLEDYSKKKTLVWSCNFTCLANDYRRFYNKNNVMCASFSNFLYSNISAHQDWRDCNSLEGSGPKTKWCVAWLNIKGNFDDEILDSDFLDTFSDKPRSKSYLRDVETLMNWLIPKSLMSKFNDHNSKVKDHHLLQLSYDDACESLYGTGANTDESFYFLNSLSDVYHMVK